MDIIKDRMCTMDCIYDIMISHAVIDKNYIWNYFSALTYRYRMYDKNKSVRNEMTRELVALLYISRIEDDNIYKLSSSFDLDTINKVSDIGRYLGIIHNIRDEVPDMLNTVYASEYASVFTRRIGAAIREALAYTAISVELEERTEEFIRIELQKLYEYFMAKEKKNPSEAIEIVQDNEFKDIYGTIDDDKSLVRGYIIKSADNAKDKNCLRAVISASEVCEESFIESCIIVLNEINKQQLKDCSVIISINGAKGRRVGLKSLYEIVNNAENLLNEPKGTAKIEESIKKTKNDNKTRNKTIPKYVAFDEVVKTIMEERANVLSKSTGLLKAGYDGMIKKKLTSVAVTNSSKNVMDRCAYADKINSILDFDALQAKIYTELKSRGLDTTIKLSCSNNLLLVSIKQIEVCVAIYKCYWTYRWKKEDTFDRIKDELLEKDISNTRLLRLNIWPDNVVTVSGLTPLKSGSNYHFKHYTTIPSLQGLCDMILKIAMTH